MNIQLFASVYDTMINDINQQKVRTQNELNNLVTEKQNALNTYENNYQTQLADYNNLMNQQQANIDTWANTQKETQQKQTDFNIGLIEQNKKDAEKQTNAEVGNAYIDYQKGLNQFGGSAETLASQGLGGTGFAKNQDIAMNITYQNRVASARSALQKANTDYNNQIQQALLNNDAALAELALKQMQQSYQLALQGFEYRQTMEKDRISYIDKLNDTYFSKTQSLQNRIDNYDSNINNLRLTQQKEAQAAAQAAQQRAWEREKYYTSLNAKNSSTPSYTDTATNTPSSVVNSTISGILGNIFGSGKTTRPVGVGYAGQSDYEVLNAKSLGYNTNGTTVASMFGAGHKDSAGRNLDNSVVYSKGNKYYVYDSRNGFVLVK